jgi:hypothetical protein
MPKPESAFLRNAMVAATVIGALVLSLSAWPLSMTPELFDSGYSLEVWSLVIAIWLMPVALIAGLALGWWGFARNRRGVVVSGLAIAALPVLLAIGYLAIGGV